MSQPIVVEIYGRSYMLRGVEPEAARRLAEAVDDRMRSIAADTATADTLKVAILAAINLADDLARLREETLHRAERAEARAADLVTRIDAALQSGAES